MDEASIAATAQDRIAAWIARPGEDPVSEKALRAASHALLDWAGVTALGAREPLTEILLRDALANDEGGTATLAGRDALVSPAFAALINGAASHALDYDDINLRMRGHPSVAVIPALLAASGSEICSGRDFLEALVAATEVACIAGEMLGAEHYERGFHTTATVGTLAAAAGVARLWGLDADKTASALGLAATQAAGLQASFGSMAKPLHAGKAAMNGFLAARWAAGGMTAGSQSLEAMGATQSRTFRLLEIRADRSEPFGIEGNVFKYHAACYYTHSAIDAALALKQAQAIAPESIERAVVSLSPAQLKVCDIEAPATALEIKFSIRHLVAMALLGIDTGAADSYSLETLRDPGIAALRGRIRTEPRTFERRTAASLSISMREGQCYEAQVDSGIPNDDLEAQEEKLVQKFLSNVVPLLGQSKAELLQRAILALPGAPDLRLLKTSLTGKECHA